MTKSRLFDDANPDKMRLGSPVVTGTPLTVFCWFKTDTSAVFQRMFALGVTGTTDNLLSMYLGTDNKVYVQAFKGSSSTVATTTTWGTGVWHNACSVFTDDSNRAVFLDGGGKNTVSAGRAATGFDYTGIGVLEWSTDIQHMSGHIARLAAWDVPLTDGEVALLAAGVHPRKIREEALVFFPPMTGQPTEIDEISGRPLTLSGTTPANGPPLREPLTPLDRFAFRSPAVAANILPFMLQNGLYVGSHHV